MTPDSRTDALIADLLKTLDRAARLVDRGRDSIEEDEALSLAVEAICNRVGDIAKKLMETDPVRFADPEWRKAAQNRDFVVHQYHRLEIDSLWLTVSESFPALRAKIQTTRPIPFVPEWS